jgi:hypothetical protein
MKISPLQQWYTLSRVPKQEKTKKSRSSLKPEYLPFFAGWSSQAKWKTKSHQQQRAGYGHRENTSATLYDRLKDGVLQHQRQSENLCFQAYLQACKVLHLAYNISASSAW